MHFYSLSLPKLLVYYSWTPLIWAHFFIPHDSKLIPILLGFAIWLFLQSFNHSLVHTTLLKLLISSREHSESEFRYLDERSVNELLGQAHSITCIFQKLEYLWSKKEISENSKVNTNGTLFTWTILQSMHPILAFYFLTSIFLFLS